MGKSRKPPKGKQPRKSLTGDAPPKPELSRPWHKHRDLVVGVLLATGAAIMTIALLLLPVDNKSRVALLVLMFLLIAFSFALVMHYFDQLRIGIVGGILISGSLTGPFGWYVWPKPIPAPAAVSDNSDSSLDDDSQYEILDLSPEKKAEIDKLRAPLYQIKAKMLDSPEYYKLRVAKDDFRTTVEKIEQQYGCLIDTVTVTCLPKPPLTITANHMDIDFSVKMVADEISKTFFWVIRDGVKLRVPIVLFVSLTNRHKEPIKVDLLYLEAKSIGGWTDIRMADTLVNNVQGMDKKPLVLQGTNAAMSLKGEYLIPSLYDRVIQPGEKVEGWIIAEYPKGIKYGNSIGDMRISLLAANHWIASKTFPANPRVYDQTRPKEFYFTLLDTLITEDR